MNQKDILYIGIDNSHKFFLPMSQKVAHVHELILCMDKCMKSLMLKIFELNGALNYFDRNRISPLYKGDKIVYTLDEMKAFCDVEKKLDDSFTDWKIDHFKDKFLKFVQEMTRIEKWTTNFIRIR